METPKRHPHADLINAWADGAAIQVKVYRKQEAPTWVDIENPPWSEGDEYRIKPESDVNANVGSELEDGTLEIEGYVREDHLLGVTKKVGGWTKFDPCEEATYPPKGKFLAWGLPDPDGYGAPVEFICWRDDDCFSCHESADPEVLYWQLLPNPPVKKARSENESK